VKDSIEEEGQIGTWENPKLGKKSANKESGSWGDSNNNANDTWDKKPESKGNDAWGSGAGGW